MTTLLKVLLAFLARDDSNLSIVTTTTPIASPHLDPGKLCPHLLLLILLAALLLQEGASLFS